MSDKTKGALSQRAAKAMNRPGFPDAIMENPKAQQDFVVAVSKADSFTALPVKYQTAIKQAEKGADAKTVTVTRSRTRKK